MTDKTDSKEDMKHLDALDYVKDIINVLNLDKTVYFLNKSGYSFYGIKSDKIIKKKCYQMLNRNETCKGCLFEKSLKIGKAISGDIYIPELNKFINISYNPIRDINGKIIKMLVRSTDITEKEVYDKKIENRNSKYFNMMNNFPIAIIILEDNRVVEMNEHASKLIGIKPEEMIGKSLYSFLNEKDQKRMHKKIMNLKMDKKVNYYDCYNFNLKNGKKLNASISSSYFEHNGHSKMIVLFKDITDEKKELDRAYTYQTNSLQLDYPIDKVNIEKIYKPSGIVSGDFYRIKKVNDNYLIGMITDVKGKGVSAALNISAFDILYMQELKNTNKPDPMKIVQNLNKRLINYYEENYIAVCSFSIDFEKKEFTIVGAGMNSFIYQKNKDKAKTISIPGSFLGMFDNSEFSQITIKFEKGDKFYLFTDGMDFILDDIIKKYLGKVLMKDFIKYLNDYIEDIIIEEGSLKDDCTFIGMQIL
ncbi:SpoIIE family protein phosphatase [Clostridium sp. BJN0001]|uniref:SpoIIE family protein phosphatase n=1 Tax=Clostridium sp. BJN0001 TaxID=2930219 RepID=UPI001FD12B56|nr:SpoIIE family protein phosphatase [Clostridium sp. BJN0001]